jgi:hypothetical protein
MRVRTGDYKEAERKGIVTTLATPVLCRNVPDLYFNLAAKQAIWTKELS